MKKEQIAAQLCTLRDFLKIPADIATSMKKVKALGFDAVQVSGMGEIAESEFVKILDGEGLVCCAAHEPGATIVDDVQKAIDRLSALNCKYTAYPYPHANPKTENDFLELAKSLDVSGKKMADAGQVLTYHNHGIEFERFGNRTEWFIIEQDVCRFDPFDSLKISRDYLVKNCC